MGKVINMKLWHQKAPVLSELHLALKDPSGKFLHMWTVYMRELTKLHGPLSDKDILVPRADCYFFKIADTFLEFCNE